MKVITLEQAINEIKSLDNAGYITRSTNHICEDMRYELKEFDAIPLDEVKQAREEIENLETQIQSYHNDDPMISQSDVLEILDKLLAESEG